MTWKHKDAVTHYHLGPAALWWQDWRFLEAWWDSSGPLVTMTMRVSLLLTFWVWNSFYPIYGFDSVGLFNELSLITHTNAKEDYPFHPDDCILLVKYLVNSQSLSQPPLAALPVKFAERLIKNLESLPRNLLSDRAKKELHGFNVHISSLQVSLGFNSTLDGSSNHLPFPPYKILTQVPSHCPAPCYIASGFCEQLTWLRKSLGSLAKLQSACGVGWRFGMISEFKFYVFWFMSVSIPKSLWIVMKELNWQIMSDQSRMPMFAKIGNLSVNQSGGSHEIQGRCAWPQIQRGYLVDLAGKLNHWLLYTELFHVTTISQHPQKIKYHQCHSLSMVYIIL